MTMTFRHTRYTCYLSCAGHAVINNLSPLLFLTFQRTFGIGIERIGLLISINFLVQMATDYVAAKYADRIGYRRCMIFSQILCVLGLLGLGTLPFLLPSAYAGLVVAVIISGIGGGLMEVLLSPIVESLPGDEKAAAMSMLHSFYCWGHVVVVLVSTLYFVVIGTAYWYFLPALWALVPLTACLLFTKVPINQLPAGDSGQHGSVRKLFSVKIFWVLFIVMIASGAAEQSMSQWSSLFAEAGLGVSKTMGDLLGPCAFAVMMGLARLAYGIYGAKIKIRAALLASSALCIACYVITAFSSWPVLSLLACAFCGLSVGLMWPGTLSVAAADYPQGGTAMFAILALGGDIGCAVGPGLVGWVAGLAEGLGHQTQMGLRLGLGVAVIFPLLTALGLMALKRLRGGEAESRPGSHAR